MGGHGFWINREKKVPLIFFDMYISQKRASLPLQTNININSNINSSKNFPIAERISLLTLIRFCGATS